MSLQQAAVSVQDRQRFTAYDARRSTGFLAVPLAAIREHGQAAQTLATVLSVLRDDGKRTFRRQETIAKMAGLSVRTVRRHLAKLESAGVLKIMRSITTSEVRLVAPESDLMESGFVPVPRYTLSRTWSERIVYGWLVYRSELSRGGTTCTDSVGAIAGRLGLSKRAVQYAIAGLVAAGLIARETVLDGDNGRFELLAPASESGGAKTSAPQQGDARVAAVTPKKGCNSVRRGMQKWPHNVRRDGRNSIRSKNSGMDQKFFSVDQVAPIAAEVFRRVGYCRDNGRNLWKLAALLAAGRISEHELWDACQGCRECSPADRPAYVYAIIRRHMADRGADLRAELAAVRIEPTWPSGPPETAETVRVKRAAESMADLLARRGLG